MKDKQKSSLNNINWGSVSKLIAGIGVFSLVLYFPSIQLKNITLGTIASARAVEVVKNKAPEVVKAVPGLSPAFSDALLTAGWVGAMFGINMAWACVRTKIFPSLK